MNKIILILQVLRTFKNPRVCLYDLIYYSSGVIIAKNLPPIMTVVC